MSRIGVVGAGYVGSPSPPAWPSWATTWPAATSTPNKVARLSQGDVPIVERGLPELVRKGLEAGRLRFVFEAAPAATGREFAYLCVPTPGLPDGSTDLS